MPTPKVDSHRWTENRDLEAAEEEAAATAQRAVGDRETMTTTLVGWQAAVTADCGGSQPVMSATVSSIARTQRVFSDGPTVRPK